MVTLFAGTEKHVMPLRPYQSAMVDACLEKFKEKRRLLAVMPTGSGKTICFSHLAQRWPGRTLILAHRDELIDQALDKLYNATGLEADKEKADDYGSLDAPVIVGSVQTLMRPKRQERWPRDHFGLIVVDEAHHVLADSYKRVLEYFDACVLGVTATPDRGDKKSLGKYFEDLAYEITLLDLINQCYLCRIKIKTIPIKISLEGVRTDKGDYDVNDLGERITQYLAGIARAIRENTAFRKILIFLPLIKTSLAMRDQCRAVGLSCEHIDGTSEDRKEILQRFARNEFDVLCNAMLLTEGYDCPDVDAVVCLRPTKIRSLYCQMVGRGTRIANGKDHLLLLDFLWMHERHDLIKPANLISKNERQADAMQVIAETGAEVELEGLAGAADAEIERQIEAESEAKRARERALMDAVKANAGRTKRFIDAMSFALDIHATDLEQYEPEFGWESDDPTPKQLLAIANMGIDPASIKFKGLASKILDKAFTRRKMNLATPKQLAILKRFNCPDAEQVSFKRAGVLITGYLGGARAHFRR